MEHNMPYIYTYTFHESEEALCHMELTSLFGQQQSRQAERNIVETDLKIAPDRSPFISMRLDVLFVSDNLNDVLSWATSVELEKNTFKVKYIKHGDSRTYQEQRELERIVGMNIHGKADMRNPDITYGVLVVEGRWIVGECCYADAIWLKHRHKPQNYSTGLSSHVARALVNIAVPHPHNMKVIDPCCGMGNVLIEALSMNINIIGRDLNPLAIQGARVNLQHFGYDASSLVSIGDMNEVTAHYDAAILDMPYNLCSVLPEQERITMLSSLKRFSERSVIVSSQNLEKDIQASDLHIKDYCSVRKGCFVRNVWLCY